jgi:DNA adenine methylase
MGSKNKIANEILPLILKDRLSDQQWYVEPFVGGCNTIDKVSGKRIGNDNNLYLISMWKALQNGWNPPELITEDLYNQIRTNKENYEPELVGYVGFLLSFGAKWFGGYRRDVAGTKGDIDNMKTQSRRALNSILKQSPFIQNVKFTNVNYWQMTIPKNSIIYCDPPYEGTTKYKGETFDYIKFWNWVREMSKIGHYVFVSEYNAPKDFECIWQKDVNVTLSKQDGIVNCEKLFTYIDVF